MKTQKLIRHVIAAWFQKHGRGGFQLVWQPTKRDENGEMHNTDSFFDMLTFPNSAEKTQKIFYDTKKSH